MSDPVDVKIWENRWKALKSVIIELKTTLQTVSIDREDTFEVLLEALQEFGNLQFDFFYKGFGFGEDRIVTLEKSEQYPPEFVLRWTLDQLSHDIHVIENAIKQREDSNKSETLKQADLLAFRAIEPIISKGEDTRLLPENTTAITYFQKTPQVRLIPYAPVALIGIPYSAIEQAEGVSDDSNKRDFLAIPHEVGHFVYWYGRLKGERLHVLLQQRLSQKGWRKYAHWLEEIFADVYGCMVGGAVIALSFQDLQMDNLPTTWIEDDGKHPAAVIRPYIYNQVLANSVDSKTLNTLKKLWYERLAARGNPNSFFLKSKTNGAASETITVNMVNEQGQGEKELFEIIGIIQKVLEPYWFENKIWVDNIADEVDPASSLYGIFAEKLNTADFFNTGKFTTPDLPNEAILDIVKKSSGVLNPLRELDVGENNKKPIGIWTIVMNADGWGNGGPECESGSGIC